MVAGNLQVIYRNSIAYSWSLLCYAAAGFCLLFLLWHFLALPRGRARRPHRWLVSNVTVHEIQSGIRVLTSSRRAWASLLFLLLFPVPSALMLKVALLFLLRRVMPAASACRRRSSVWYRARWVSSPWP